MTEDTPSYLAPPEPAGFGNCGSCAYYSTGPISRCYACASSAMQALSPARCPVCDQSLDRSGARCSNWICNSPDRQFAWIMAIALKSGSLETAIWALKDGKWGWGYIFARVVLGFLYEHPHLTQGLDLIIPMPSYLPPGTERRGHDHAGFVIEQAAEQDEEDLPFVVDPPVIVKTRPTGRMRETASAAGRRELAQQIAHSLVVPDPTRVAGRDILVYDDVFTGGNTLNAVAGVLKAAGAREVYGLTLARQQWGTRSS